MHINKNSVYVQTIELKRNALFTTNKINELIIKSFQNNNY